MIRKIVLTNFMAHEFSAIHLTDGLNVLVGPNNVGKSTVAVALKILARNTNSNFVMQHDQKECSVQVETSEGHTIEWIKRKSPSYVINGQTKDRLGRGGTPPELEDTLRLAPVEFEDKEFEPHFGEQKSPIFLINRSPSQIAQFFSTTSDAERLLAMQRMHQKNKSEAQSKAKTLAESNVSLQQALNSLQELPELEMRFLALEREGATLVSLEQQIAELDQTIQTYAGLVRDQQFESLCISSLQDLEPVPVLHSVAHMESVVNQWQIYSNQYAMSSESVFALKDIVVPPVMLDLLPLESSIKTYRQVSEREHQYHEVSETMKGLLGAPVLEDDYGLLETLKTLSKLDFESVRLTEVLRISGEIASVPKLNETEGLETQIESLQLTQNDVFRCGSVLELFSELSAALEIEETRGLDELIVALANRETEVQKVQGLLAAIETDKNSLESMTKQWLRTKPLCPCCGAKLTVDSIRFHR